jgi:MFS family permease
MGALAGLAFAIFYVIAGFPLARLADRGVRRTIIAISLSVWSLFTLLCGFAQSYVHLLLARIGVAVGESGGMPATHSMVADLYPLSRRGFAISIIGARGAFMALAVPGLILAAIFRLSVREPARVLPHNNSKDTTPPLREVASTLWRIKSFRSFLVGGFGLSFAGVGMLVWAPTFLMRVHHATPQEAGQMFGLAVAVGLCGGQLASGYLADRLGQRDVRWYAWLGGVGAVLAAPFGLGFLFVPDQMTAMVAFAIYLLLMSCWNVPFLAICLTMAPPRTRAMVSALYVMCVNLGGIGLGSVFVGAMNDVLTSRYGPEAIRHSLTLVMGVSVLAGLACALASRWLRDDVRSSALSQDA